MMNWKEINKKCPKAFDLFFEWFKGDPKAGITKKNFLKVNDIIMMGGNIRELYDFFDKQEIFGWVSPEIQYTRELDEDGINPHYVPEEWGHEIHDTAYKYELDIDYSFTTRTEAEDAMFEEEFEILEGKLNKS
ncbi:MAG: hypothetical protein U9O59_01850 [Actinomycetota bacterium]|nr:hypothetical protein [Actinomycetota bacterium]